AIANMMAFERLLNIPVIPFMRILVFHGRSYSNEGAQRIASLASSTGVVRKPLILLYEIPRSASATGNLATITSRRGITSCRYKNICCRPDGTRLSRTSADTSKHLIRLVLCGGAEVASASHPSRGGL